MCIMNGVWKKGRTLEPVQTLTTASHPGEETCGATLSCLRGCLTSNCVKWPVMETCHRIRHSDPETQYAESQGQ